MGETDLAKLFYKPPPRSFFYLVNPKLASYEKKKTKSDNSLRLFMTRNMKKRQFMKIGSVESRRFFGYLVLRQKHT